MSQLLALSFYVNHARDHRLHDHFAAPQARKLGCVQSASRGRLNSRLDDATVLSMDAVAAEDDCVELGAIVADPAPSIETVDGVDRGAIVSCR